MNHKTLFVTVGGSPTPVVEAVQKHAATHVVFVCSESSPGSRGSRDQVEDPGMVCCSKPGRDRKPNLPNIPTQARLRESSYEIFEVPADKPAEIVQKLAPKIAQAMSQGAVVADYTGGTKSMSAGLILAALESPDIDISVVLGLRPNLDKVLHGSQVVTVLDTSGLRARLWLEDARRAWSRYSYSEAQTLLASTGTADEAIYLARYLSTGYAAWDAFDHAKAYEILQPVGGDVPRGLMPALAQLIKPRDNRNAEAHRIWDLRFMADRRAQSGRYDTAVLLLYRTFEWVAQWGLRWPHGILTDNVPNDRTDLDDLVIIGHDEKRKLGLHNAWIALSRLDSPFQAIAESTAQTRLSFANRRNQSLYAHGFTPLGHHDYEAAQTWLDQEILPTFLQVAFNGEPPFKQLPTTF